MTELHAGADFRRRELRREVFLRFYVFHTKYRSHPGGVYYALPALTDDPADVERLCWTAFLNGNTQNPVTTALLLEVAPTVDHAHHAVDLWRARYDDLWWDTDRRHHKAKFDRSVAGYLELTKSGQADYWARAAERGWPAVWDAAHAIPTFGRLSAWSYLEYLRLLGVPGIPDADTLMLGDRDGSRSHRNGLALVTGRDDWIWWDNNPDFDGRYTPQMVEELAADGAALLAEARTRLPGHPDVGYLTLESALCTYKSWHRPRRRYPGVYNDMLYDRLRRAEARFGDRFQRIWQARAEALPRWLRLEENPFDPGCMPVKQDWYRLTGEVIMMEREWPIFRNGFAEKVEIGAFGRRPT